MNGTSLEFFVLKVERANPRYLFLLISDGGIVGSWTLVNAPPEEAGIKRLAIEGREEEPNDMGLFEDSIPERFSKDAQIWDRGRAEMVSERGAKIEFLLHGKRLWGRHIMVVPSWGRNTERRLWILFKIPPRKEKAPKRPGDKSPSKN